MRIIISVFVFLFLINNKNLAQNTKLYIPLNIQKAIDSGTRSNNGKPGINYWQNKSEYKINAEILPDSGYLIGNEVIAYHNNSPDTLNNIVIRIYQDIAKIGAVRDWYIGMEGLNKEVKINYLIISDDTLDLSPKSKNVKRGSTNLSVRLNKPLAPKANVEIKIGWEFKIPKKFKIRMGDYGNGNLYVAYWYPEVAVYDDIDGWDRLDYQGSVEFYNDFSDFDISLKVPAGYVLWVTGDLQNAKEVLREDIYNKYKKAQQSDETVNIITQQDYEKGIVTSSNEFNTWHFIAKNVTSAAFAMSNSYNWDGASVEVDNKTGRRVLTDAVYPDSTIHWDSTAQYARSTIEYLSTELPGYPYPYSHATSYCNGRRGGGMESPMMANDGAPQEKSRHIGLIFHEIAHNYFPFIMGTNERKYAWMDEGWASFFPREVVNKYVPEADYGKYFVTSLSKSIGNESELPPIVPSYSYKGRYSRIGFYTRPATAYYELKELLGNKLFKKALLEYMNRWNGKHPIPIDFFNTFNDAAGEDLSWFWNPWFYEFGYPDLAVTEAENGNGFVTAKIKKIGNIPTRVNITFEFEDGTTKIIKKSSRVWSEGKKEFNIRLDTKKRVVKITVGNDYIVDAVKENNVYEF